MSVARLAIVAYIVFLTLGVLAGQWPLQGPELFASVGSHGIHAGDVVVIAASALASIGVLSGKP